MGRNYRPNIFESFYTEKWMLLTRAHYSSKTTIDKTTSVNIMYLIWEKRTRLVGFIIGMMAHNKPGEVFIHKNSLIPNRSTKSNSHRLWFRLVTRCMQVTVYKVLLFPCLKSMFIQALFFSEYIKRWKFSTHSLINGSI